MNSINKFKTSNLRPAHEEQVHFDAHVKTKWVSANIQKQSQLQRWHKSSVNRYPHENQVGFDSYLVQMNKVVFIKHKKRCIFRPRAKKHSISIPTLQITSQFRSKRTPSSFRRFAHTRSHVRSQRSIRVNSDAPHLNRVKIDPRKNEI